MLANSLRGVLAQLLIKKADGSGRVAVNEILMVGTAPWPPSFAKARRKNCRM